MPYLIFYIVFGLVFVTGIIGYWLITKALRDPLKIYVADGAA